MRLLDKPCKIWTGPKRNGYGMKRHNGRWMDVHLVVWEEAHGERTPGYEIDHLCNVRACYELTHLEQVTKYENNMRSNSAPAVNARKTVCMRGHELRPRKDGTGRICPTCNYDKLKEARRRKRAM